MSERGLWFFFRRAVYVGGMLMIACAHETPVDFTGGSTWWRVFGGVCWIGLAFNVWIDTRSAKP